MAIWQYQLIVVPEKSIQIDYQCIFKNNKTKFLPATDFLWENYDLDTSALLVKMDQIIARANWSGDTLLSWKGNTTNEEDNDCSIYLNENKTQIKEFHFRVDLRKAANITNFLIPILKLCEVNKLVIIDLKGDIHKPKIEDLVVSVKSSNATAFLTDPIVFIDNLSKFNDTNNLKNTPNNAKKNRIFFTYFYDIMSRKRKQ